MIRFIADDAKEGRFSFSHSQARNDADEQLCCLMDKWRSGRATLADVTKKADAILKRFPDFLDAYQAKAAAFIDLAQQFRTDPAKRTQVAEMLKEAMAECGSGLSIAKQAMPDGFKGVLSWYELDNRPFLRLHHSQILVLIEQKNYRTAAQEIVQHLRWNPNDNIGLRMLLGFVYWHAGDLKKAYKTMAKYADEYPPYRYAQALMEFKSEEYVRAARTLRLAFLENTYIAESVVYGAGIPSKHNLSECGPYERFEMVAEYEESGLLKEWHKDVHATNFLRWLYYTPEAATDRVALAKYKNTITFRNSDRPGEFFACEQAGSAFRSYLNGITIENTTPLVRKVQTWRDYRESVWPWDWLWEKETPDRTWRKNPAT